MIYAGSMEIAVRNYGQYGLVILGSMAGVLTIYQISAYISDMLPVTKRSTSPYREKLYDCDYSPHFTWWENSELSVISI